MFLIMIAVEFIAPVSKILFNLKNEDIVKRLHIRRTYRSYPGAILIIMYFIYGNIWFFVVGGALALSDLLHRFFTIPYTSIYGIKITETPYGIFFIVLKKLSGVILVLIGVFALVTPLTPGAWLGIVGLILLVGKIRTLKIIKTVLGERNFNKISVQKYISKIPID